MSIANFQSENNLREPPKAIIGSEEKVTGAVVKRGVVMLVLIAEVVPVMVVSLLELVVSRTKSV